MLYIWEELEGWDDVFEWDCGEVLILFVCVGVGGVDEVVGLWIEWGGGSLRGVSSYGWKGEDKRDRRDREGGGRGVMLWGV